MDNQQEEKKPLPEMLRETWAAAFSALTTTIEGETRKVVDKLSHLGNLSQEETSRLVGDLKAIVKKNREELELRVEDAVKKAVERLKIPTQEEVESMRERVEVLSRRVEQLSREQEEGSPPRGTAAAE